jgi:hypothetical protein
LSLVATTKEYTPTVAPATFDQVAPRSRLICHCTVGTGEPDAVAVNVTASPAATVAFWGSAVSVGAVVVAVTASTASAVVALPALLVNTARKRLPSSAGPVVNANVVDVAPPMSANADAPGAATCHWTAGVGVPLAAALKLAV